MTKVLDGITDLTSVTGIALKVVEILTGRKPLEEAMQFLTGDWAAFSRAGAAWKKVGQAVADIGENLDRGSASIDHGWDGDASELAYRLFQSIADVFKKLPGSVQQTRRGLQGVREVCLHHRLRHRRPDQADPWVSTLAGSPS